MYRLKLRSIEPLIGIDIESILLAEESSTGVESSSTTLDLKFVLSRSANVKPRIEIRMSENGPQSDIEDVPHTSVEKYRAIDEPLKAPNEPPALIMPKYIFACSLLK
tara:strand:+ start:578 stop:898 length:321 start_codon:yes stop_codon:yes gene_type:complete